MESGTGASEHPEAGGLIVMVRTNPAHAARALAEDLRAELAIGGQATERALRQYEADAEPAAPADLDQLAAAMRRAEAIREQTRAAAAERLATSFNTRLAIHPDTIRRAAATLLEARATAEATERRIVHRARAARWSRRVAVLAILAAAAAVGVLVDVGIGAGIAGAGAVVVAAVLIRRRLRQPSAFAPPTPVWQVELDRAQRQWSQVTGPGADPTDVESVVRRYEPQHPLVTQLVTESPAVRAADRLAIERRAAWVAAWRAAVGDDGPLSDPRLGALLRRSETEIWLDTGGVPTAGPPTLVVADPYADLSEERARSLHRRLLELPAGHRVIVVLEPDPEHPSGARLPRLGSAITADA